MWSVKTILGTSRSRMQQPIAACTRAQFQSRLCPYATCNWLLHPASTGVQDGLGPLQLALVVFFMPSISAKSSLALAVGIVCNLCWWCFSCANCVAHILMCSLPYCHHALQLALLVLYLYHMHTCTHAHMHTHTHTHTSNSTTHLHCVQALQYSWHRHMLYILRFGMFCHIHISKPSFVSKGWGRLQWTVVLAYTCV